MGFSITKISDYVSCCGRLQGLEKAGLFSMEKLRKKVICGMLRRAVQIGSDNDINRIFDVEITIMQEKFRK